MSAVTKFPSVVSYLVTTVGAAVTSDVRVFDGAEDSGSYPQKAVAIAHDGSIGSPEMTIASMVETDAAFAGSQDEEGTIHCSLWYSDGGNKFPALRTGAVALFDTVKNAIQSDRTLGGLCNYSIVKAQSITTRSTPGGKSVLVNFTVDYKYIS
jgi:hypothetical protein